MFIGAAGTCPPVEGAATFIEILSGKGGRLIGNRQGDFAGEGKGIENALPDGQLQNTLEGIGVYMQLLTVSLRQFQRRFHPVGLVVHDYKTVFFLEHAIGDALDHHQLRRRALRR